MEFEGVRYSHIIDPATGLGVPEAPIVVAIAADATSADVLASSLTVMGRREGLAFIRAIPGVAARVSGSGGYETENFPQRHGAYR
jgi:thiamine biosynthesis lipoprotein